MAGFKRERNKAGQLEKGCGRWELIVNAPRDPATGRRRQVSRIFYGKARDADHELARLDSEVRASRRVGSTEKTLSTVIALWLDEAEGELSPTTMREYRRVATQRIAPKVGKLPLRKVTAGELTAFYAALRKAGLKPQTIRNVHTVINGGLAWAVRAEWIGSNPARDAKRPRGASARRPPPTKDEVRRLIAGCTEGRRKNHELAAMVRLGIACGGRRGELVGLRRTRVNLDSGSITIKKAVAADGKKLVEKDTKTHQERTVELGPRAVQALRDHLERMDKRAADAGARIAKNAFVFSDAMDCSKPWRPNRVTLAFGRLRDRVLPERPKDQRVRFHDLRHARGTWELDEGIPLPSVSERLGHKDPSTTSRIYAHGTDTHNERAAGIGDDVQ